VIRLDVRLTFPDGARCRCGELAFTEPGRDRRFQGAFRYAPEYRGDPRAFALDPRGLPLEEPPPLGEGGWTAQGLEPPLAVFADALPDDWGRRLLIRRHRLTGPRQTEPYLLGALAGQGLGALGFYPAGLRPDPMEDPSAGVVELPALMDAAWRLDAGAEVDPDLARLLRAGSSAGGARPKALVRDSQGHWLAKLPAPGDIYDMVGLEAASVQVARAAGLEVPEVRLVEAGGRRCLLARRFDRTAAGGRRHRLSLSTLFQEAPGRVAQAYTQLFPLIRKHSADPEAAAQVLFRQMVLNALLGNTDDHLKNFQLLHDRGWRLSPAFDLLPDVAGRREHVLLFAHSAYPPSRGELAALGRRLAIRRTQAVVEEVATAVAGFPAAAAECGVPAAQIAHFAQDLQGRLGRSGG
jgi:serine/threonine-protein kinase HipA